MYACKCVLTSGHLYGAFESLLEVSVQGTTQEEISHILKNTSALHLKCMPPRTIAEVRIVMQLKGAILS